MAVSPETKAKVLAMLKPADAGSAYVPRGSGSSDFKTPARAAGKRARKRRAREADSGGGGLLPFSPKNLVTDTLKVLDYPRRGVLGGALYGGGWIDKEILGREKEGELAMRQGRKAFAGEFTGKDYLKKRWGVDLPDLPIIGDVGGFAFDVATDPLTYAAGAGVLTGGGKAVGRRVLTEGVERVAAERLAQQGLVSGAGKVASSGMERGLADLIEGAARTSAREAAAPVAQKVVQHGVSSLTKEEALKWLGTSGGLRFVVPGTGRVGRLVTRAADEVTVPILPKTITDPINQVAFRARQGVAESAVGRAVGEKLGGEKVKYLLDRIAKTSPSAAVVADALDTGRLAERTSSESAVIFREKLRSYVDEVRPKLKANGKAAVRGVETGDLASAPGAAELKALFDDVKNELRSVGVDVGKKNYVSRVKTAEAKKATSSTSRGGAQDFTKRRWLDDMIQFAGMNPAEVREAVERYGRDTLGLKGDYFESHPDQIVPTYLKVMEEKYSQALLKRRLEEAGIARRAHVDGTILDRAAIREQGKAGQALERASLKVGKSKERLNAADAARAEKVRSLVDRIMNPDALSKVDALPAEPDLAALLGEVSAKQAAGEAVGRAPFEALGVRDLRGIAKANGITNADRMAKAELVDLLAKKTEAGDFVASTTNSAAWTQGRKVAKRELSQLGVRDLRPLAKENGIAGADRMSKSDLVDLLSDKALDGSLTSAARAEAAFTPKNPDLLAAHDRVFKSPWRSSGRGQAYPQDVKDLDEAYSHLDSLKHLASKSATPDEYKYYLDEAERQLRMLRPSAAPDVAGRTQWGDVVRSMERVLTDIHEEAIFGRGMRAANAEIDDLLGAFPHLADPAARQRILDDYYQGGDKLSGGYHVELRAVDRINEILGTEGGVAGALAPALDVERLNSEVAAAAREAQAAEDRMLALLSPDQMQADIKGARQEAARAEDLLRSKASDLDVKVRDQIARQKAIVKQKREQLRLFEAASREANKEARQVATLEAQRARAEAAYLEDTRNVAQAEERLRQALARPTTKTVSMISDEVRRGAFAMLDPYKDLAAPAEIVEALTATTKVMTPEGVSDFLHYYDKALNYIKAWQIASPGFSVRNFMGGAFNNYLAGMDVGGYNRYWRARAGKFTNARTEEAYNLWREHGSIGQYGSHEVTTGLKHESLMTRLNPLSSKNGYVHAMQWIGGEVEDVLRGSLFMDAYLKTGSVDEALASVYKYHFNYDDMSRFEQGTIKRIIPFYTWTRKNFPLQIERMLARPGKYTWYNHWTANMDGGERDSIVPQYFNDIFAVPTGIRQGGPNGGQMYITPDLPFTRTMTEALPWENGKPSIDPWLSQMTPLIKTPLEISRQRQLFKGIPFSTKRDAMPAAWAAIPGLKTALQTVGVVDAKGTIKGGDAYVIEQYLPLLARLRRLVPSEKKYQDRVTSGWMSFVGVPLRTNTKYEQRTEKYRRYLAKTDAMTIRVPKKK